MRRTACERCRAQKIKCTPNKPCRPCLQSGSQCVAPGLRLSRNRQPLIAPATVDTPVMLQESSIVDLGKQLLDHDQVMHPYGSVDAIPGSLAFRIDQSTAFRWRDELPYELPAVEVLDVLSDSYFNSVNWFMMVLDQAKFRARSSRALANEYINMDDRNFVFLMSLIWGLGAHYIWANPATSSSMPIPTSLLAEMMKVVDVAYSRITASPTLETVQIAILLGSFHLFNGSPYLGFAIFGSGVRCAQAIGLHRQPRTSSSTGESCLVWWALEISDKYAAVAFGLPCGVDDSDCDVPEINDKDKSQPDDPVSSINLTYHKLKGRLYRIMGPFLGRKKQTNQLRSLLHVRRELKEWHASVPEWLKCSTDSPEFNRRPTQVQMQAVALQLAYDNLQMVLFRQAAFPRNRWEYPVDRHQAEAIKDLSEAAIRTASISTFAAARLICQSSHAAMHVAICSFTAGVILSLMIASQPNDPESSTQLESLKNIINLFEQFPSQNYRLATQSLTLLKALEFRVDPQLAQGSGEDIRFSNRHSLHYQPKRNNPGPVQDLAMMGEDNNNTPNTATNILEFNFGDLGFSSNAGGPLDDVGQLWLWDDLSNENWMPNFQ